MTSRVFVDPMLHSPRVGRIQVAGYAIVLLLFLAAIWARWYIVRGDLRGPLLMSSGLAAAFGVGYYMLERNRELRKARTWLEVGEDGLRSMTIAGEVEAGWPEVIEVRVGNRPTRSRAPDVMIRTERGWMGAFLRWVDREGGIPEPVLVAPGRRFRYPDGREVTLVPAESELVRALKQYLPPEKIKEGVILSL